MKNKTFTIAASGLNTHSVTVFDSYLDLQSSTSGALETRRYYPNKIQYINRTGVDVQTNIFSSLDEYNAYVADSTNYDFFTILNNTAVTLTSQSLLPTAYKIAVMAPSGTATTAFTVECIGYQPKGF